MVNKTLEWKLYLAKKRQARALEEKRKEQMKFFPTFLKKNVDKVEKK